MREIASDLERWRSRGERVALATVVATSRSAPRPVGSTLAVSESGELAGSVSGGCVENEVYEHAREVLRGDAPRLLEYGITDDMAFEVGLPCGGEIQVFVSRARNDLLVPLQAELDRDRAAVLATVVAGAGLGAQLVELEDGRRLGELPFELDRAIVAAREEGKSTLVDVAGAQVFLHVFAAPPRLVIVGAVDAAEALCRAAQPLGWRTVVVDPRARLATPERLPSAGEIVVDWPGDALARLALDRSTALVVLMHEDRFDVPALAAGLRSDAFYVGALGSRRTQARRREQLLAEGLSEHELERIAGPCGLDVGAEINAEFAVAVLAEILAARSGRTGGPLRERRAPIHAEVA